MSQFPGAESDPTDALSDGALNPSPVVVPREGGGEPEALAEPTERVRWRWTLSLALVSVGINTAIFAVLNQLMPLQALEIGGAANKESVLTLAGTVGVLVAMIVNPLVGTLSDRTTSRWGRRVPWIVAGAILATGFLLLTAGASTVGMLCLGWAGAQAGLNAMSAAVTAAVPDRVPVDQRGLVGGLVSTGITLGILVGSAIGMIINGALWLGYLLAIVVMLACAVPYVLRPNDPVLPRGALPRGSFLALVRGFWVSPRRHPDFAWAWLGRLLMMTATQLTIVYLLFYLTDVLKHPDPAAGVFQLTAVYALCTLLFAGVAGKLSDRTGRRPLVAASSALIAAAAVLMACAPLFGAAQFTVALVAAAILGLGNGAYLGVDFALLTQVLPTAAERGKDMGLINIAASLPQIFALGLAYLAVTKLGGYTTLFALAGAVGVLGALSVYRIKSVR